MTRRLAIISAATCCLALVAGCDRRLPGKPDLANRPVPADQITDFAPLYQMYCAGCHGADGKLGPAPPLNDAIFLAIIPDSELLRLIDAGRPGTPMPGFSRQHGGSLTDAQVRALAEGIKPQWIGSLGSKSQRGKSDGQREEPALPPGDLPAYAFALPDKAAAADAIARGKDLFAAACADCHGSDGEGGDAGRLHEPNFLALISDQALRRIIITGRPDLGMPNFAVAEGRSSDFQALSSAQIDDLVAFLAQWRTAGPEPDATAGPSAASGPPSRHTRRRGFLLEARQ